MRKISTLILAGLACAAPLTIAAAQSAPAATTAPPSSSASASASPAPAAKLSSDSTVRALLADSRTKAILQANVPLIVEHAPDYPEIYDMSLKALAGMTEAQTMGGLTPDVFKKIDAALNAL